MRTEIIGDATLYCGDCMEILPALGKGDFDLVVMDPPYMFTTASCGFGKLNPWADMCNGSRFFSDLYLLLKTRLPKNGALWTFLSWKTIPAIQKAVFDAEWDITSMLIWDKECIGLSGPRGLRTSYEMVALMCHPEFKIANRGIPDIRRCKWASHKPTGHPAEKPINLVKWLIEISGATRVIDPFMGSGTTGAACATLGKQYIGIELDEKWFSYSCKRIEKAWNNNRLLDLCLKTENQEQIAL